MSERLKLVSAGREVKVWECSKYALCYAYGSELGTTFRSVHWSPEFNYIISTPSSAKFALLTSVKGAALSHYNIDTGYDNTVACFTNVTGRHVGIGTKIGKVSLWDVKHKKPIKTFFCDKSEVNSLRCSWNDSFMAAGLANGNIVLMNLGTTQTSAPFPCAPGQSIHSLQYSYAKKHLIGCTTDDGSVYLWDTYGKRLTASFHSVHVARATGLCFSPTNNLLLTTVGLDKNLICYDTESKKPVRTLECEVPLTCIDFKEDGFTLAVGTMRGTILIFDLRNLNYPFQTVPAHTGPVNSLYYQTNIIAAAEQEKNLKKGSSMRSDTKSSKTSNFNDIESRSWSCGTENTVISLDNSNAGVTSANKDRISLTSEIFSPLKDLSGTSPNVTSASESSAPSSSNKLAKQFRKSLPRDNSLAVVFSPLEESNKSPKEISPGNDPAHVGRLSFSDCTSPNSYSLLTARTWRKPEKNASGLTFTTTKVTSPSSNLSPNKWPTEKPTFNTSANCMPDLSCLTLRGMCSSKNTASAPDPNQPGVQYSASTLTPDDSLSAKSVTVTPPSLDDTKSSDVGQVEAANGSGNDVGDSRTNGGSKDIADDINVGFIDEGKGTSVQNTPLTPEAFQTEYMRQLIMDAMEEHTDNIRRDFHTYHVQMSRQLEKQKEDLEQLFKKYSVDANLLSEVVNLKKENNFLKHAFR